MAFKRRRIVLSDTSAHDLGLGASFAIVRGYNLLSSSDTSVSLAVTDDDGKTIFTESSADFTNTTGKDGVERTLSTESAVTEDGTAATGNAGHGGVWAKSPLTLTASGLGAGTLTVDVYVEV